MATLVNKMNREVKVIIPNMREFRVFYSDNEGSIMFFKRDWEEEKTTKQEEQVWSEEDEKNFDWLHSVLCYAINDPDWVYSKREKISKDLLPFIERLKSFRPQSQRKPNEEQIRTLDIVISDYRHACTKDSDKKAEILKSLL